MNVLKLLEHAYLDCTEKALEVCMSDTSVEVEGTGFVISSVELGLTVDGLAVSHSLMEYTGMEVVQSGQGP